MMCTHYPDRNETSKGIKPQALERIRKAATQQANMATGLEELFDEADTATLQELAQSNNLIISTDLGGTPQELRRICDGSEVVNISRPIGRLGSHSPSLFHDISLEFRANGDLEFRAHNLFGNQVMGRLSAAGMQYPHDRSGTARYLARMFTMQFMAGDRAPLLAAMEAATARGTENSFYLTQDQAPYLDLPSYTDQEGLQAYSHAGVLARLVCLESAGHGKHLVGALGPGKAEGQFQFPGAPYDLFIRLSGHTLIQADFIPKPNASGEVPQSYSFNGEVMLDKNSVDEVRSIFSDYARWGREHSQKKADARPLEETLAFSALNKLLTGAFGQR